MKYKVLEVLMSNIGEYISGEALSEKLGVSRTMIWKHINDLKREGYVLNSSSKKGYMLMSIPDAINTCEIMHGLESGLFGKSVYCFEEIDSTNNYAKKIAYEGCDDGTVVVADRQLSGRGRLGRSWDSPSGKGIFMSLVMHPKIPPEDMQLVTLGASVAVVKAIKEVTGISAGIKWPNDVVIDGRKVCGILTEMASEQERISFLVVGIGINVNHEDEDFHDELKDKAISLRQHALKNNMLGEGILRRSSIIKSVLRNLESVYEHLNAGNKSIIIDEWKNLSVTLGKDIRIEIKGTLHEGTARDITNDGRLIVDCRDNVTRELLSGEISVRGMLGYI